MITRSQLTLPEYFDRYVNLTDDVSLKTALEQSLTELENLPLSTWHALGKRVYAEGKWTLHDILQHVIDTERVFCYRALSFARGEQNALPFDEELYGRNANASKRSLEDLLEEALLVRKATIKMFNSFDDVMLERVGIGFKGPYSVRIVGYIIAGHQRWHFNVIKERYMPLLEIQESV
ncbi:DinB family protein [Pseudochryseolinea flava]|uniref:DinB family protein n=1 Tax=Pseudochryseolinea flava TaxID=2059302 RepID=A0A364XXD8_9BACT|nr:DinB family protein [Pseudochryseolinea flava]RAV98925.1 DinB family protein [Pseudochryseolinea flava]